MHFFIAFSIWKTFYSVEGTIQFIFYLQECISLIIYVGFLGFMTLFSTMQTEPATLQLQACKYLPNKAVLLQLMNLGEVDFVARVTNGIHYMKWKLAGQTAPFPWALWRHVPRCISPWVGSVCCVVLWCCICVWLYFSTVFPMEHENSMLEICQGFRGFFLREDVCPNNLCQRAVVMWLHSCHGTEDDGLTCQTPLNMISKPPRSSPAAGGRYYSWLNRKR